MGILTLYKKYVRAKKEQLEKEHGVAASSVAASSEKSAETNQNNKSFCNTLQITDLHVGDRVRHVRYGSGSVTGTVDKGADSIVTVDFDTVEGAKHLLLRKSRLYKLDNQGSSDTADAVDLSSMSMEDRVIYTIAQVCEVDKAGDNQPNYHGYKLADDDLGGEPDPLWNTISTVDLEQARRQYRLYGTPGGGLSSSGFSSDEVESGQKGEQVLARMVVANCSNVVSFWSLHGLNNQGQQTVSDIDCVIAGQDKRGRTRLWFVDAKNYKGNEDTAYRNIDATHLLRISISQHAFENGVDGRPDLEISGNMDWQRKNWNAMFNARPAFRGKPIVAEWLVCMVPTTNKGIPDVAGVFWPGDIPCVTPEELVARVNAANLDSVQNIPLDMLNMFKRQLKK